MLWITLYVANRPTWDKLIYDVGGLDEESRVGSAVHFFLFDTTKIMLLLSGIIFNRVGIKRSGTIPFMPGGMWSSCYGISQIIRMR